MHTTTHATEATVLAVDVGGTNTSCAIVRTGGDGFKKLFERRYATRAEPSLVEPLGRFMNEARSERVESPGLLCVSGAGPVRGRTITLTNAPWGIDGDELEARFDLPTFVINDFSAIAWGTLLLDPNDPSELVQLPRPDGTLIKPDRLGAAVIIGAGTGLGFAYVLRDESGTRVYPSEGGHTGLPVYDDESRAFSRWLEESYGFAPGAEAGVSGQGIGHIFSFLASREAGHSALVSSIIGSPSDDRPALVAGGAESGDPLCTRAMDMFVRLYARVASDAAAVFLPGVGIYLAGGIAAKNLARFTEGHRFMGSFGMAYREHIREIAARTPVFIVKDYAISIYGAANAAVHLANRQVK